MVKKLSHFKSCFQNIDSSRYTKFFNESKYMSFLIKGDKLFKKCNKICDKVSSSIKKESESKPL